MSNQLLPLNSMLLAKPNLIILDVETTGLDPNTHQLVQISLMNNKGKIIFSSLINPGRPIPPDATKIHGIKDSDVANAPTLAEIAPLLQRFLDGSYLVAYNAGFDVHFLTHLLRNLGVAEKFFFEGVGCVMELYQEYLQSERWKPLPNLSGRESHDSCNDCYNTWLLLRKMEQGGLPNDDEQISLDF